MGGEKRQVKLLSHMIPRLVKKEAYSRNRHGPLNNFETQEKLVLFLKAKDEEHYSWLPESVVKSTKLTPWTMWVGFLWNGEGLSMG